MKTPLLALLTFVATPATAEDRGEKAYREAKEAEARQAGSAEAWYGTPDGKKWLRSHEGRNGVDTSTPAMTTVGPVWQGNCQDAVSELGRRQGGKVSRFDIRRELGPACEAETLQMVQDAADVIEICGKRIMSALRNEPTRTVTRAQVRAAGGAECEKVADQLWDGLQKGNR
jgi:hypothetical protein